MKDKTAIRLRIERARALITMTDLAKQIGVTPQTVSYWEQGRSLPRGEQLIKLHDIFGCSTDYLLGLSSERNHKQKGKLND